MMVWAIFCLLFTLIIGLLVIWPLLRHPTLPRVKKVMLAIFILLLLVFGGLVLYGWVGVPMMAVL